MNTKILRNLNQKNQTKTPLGSPESVLTVDQETGLRSQGELISESYTDGLVSVKRWFTRFDVWVLALMDRLTMPALRLGVGVVFLWFGFLKFFNGLSPVEDTVEATLVAIGQIVGIESIPIRLILTVLATWEVSIGLGLLLNRYHRLFLGLLFLQLPATFLPIFLLPGEVWRSFPLGLTLEGQFIFKNLVLVSSAFALGSKIHTTETKQNELSDISGMSRFEEAPRP